MTTQNNPLCYALTLGNTSQQILPQNPSRKALIFSNPSNNTVYICPAVSNTGQPVAATINGAGTIAIFSGGALVLPQGGWSGVGLGAAFNAIASGGGTPFTVWEF